MRKEEIDEARERLQQMRQEVLQEVQEVLSAGRSLGQDGVADLGDMSSQGYHRDLLINLSETQRRKIHDIDMALERIENGEYGICMRCEEEIPPKRMMVRPFSRYCVDCKTEVEKFGE